MYNDKLIKQFEKEMSVYNDKLIKQFEKEMSVEGDGFYAVKQQYIRWLENKVESAMCEANSNAVLADVRAMRRNRDNLNQGDAYSAGIIDGYNEAIDDIIKRLASI